MSRFHKNNSIGIFDSGVGGLTVLKRLLEFLPEESFDYYGDSGNCPYGALSSEAIWLNSCRSMDILSDHDCKLIIVACNTITTNSIDRLRKQYKVPIVGMEPGTKMAFEYSEGKRIGILATQGTLNGSLYHKTLGQFNDKAFFKSQIGHGLVELIEQNKMDSPAMEKQLMVLLQPMIDAKIDTLVLGCTHYNYLTPMLHKLFPYRIKIIDTSGAVAERVKEILVNKNLLTTKSRRILNLRTSGALKPFEDTCELLGFSSMDVNELNLSCTP